MAEHIEAPEIEFRIVSSCKCPLDYSSLNERCSICTAMVCNIYGYYCDMCYNDFGFTYIALSDIDTYNYVCAICDCLKPDTDYLGYCGNWMSFYILKGCLHYDVFTCEQCVKLCEKMNIWDDYLSRDILTNDDAGISRTYNEARRETVMNVNRQNYAIICAAKTEILTQIHEAVSRHLLRDIAGVVVAYCGFKRYIDIGE
jgi:hypothetical protein